jgi:hypothetical protein
MLLLLLLFRMQARRYSISRHNIIEHVSKLEFELMWCNGCGLWLQA